MFLVFDLGGTKMRIALSADTNELDQLRIFKTPRTYEDGLQFLRAFAEEYKGSQKLDAVCGGLAGSFNREKSVLLNGVHIASWVERPVKQDLENIFCAPVYLENDAALTGLGEAVFGAGKNYEIVVYLTVSTGVGGARITNGKIDISAMGFEPGYQIIDAGRCLSPDRDVRRLGAHISGKSLERHFGIPASQIKDPGVWEKIGQFLAIGLSNTIVHWSPDIVILGGSVMQSISLDVVREHLKETLKPFPEAPLIVKAMLGDVGGLWGGIARLQALDRF